MDLICAATSAVERLKLPDEVTRAGISALVDRTRRRLNHVDPAYERLFVGEMEHYPIAVRPNAANAQHYELPAEFFALVLGPRRKYSCCLYEDPAADLAAAEQAALAATALHAGLADGQDILELGCGWGSLSLWMAEHFPRARITAVSNSHGQRRHIEAEARRRGLHGLRVVTADMNLFDARQRFDRIVSVEMWEHMSNWRALMAHARRWLRDDGRLFLHVFSHRSAPYRFDAADPADWIARHFFTGGIMPSHGMIRHLDTHFAVEKDWRWSGTHYRRTAEHWLANFDLRSEPIGAILQQVHGRQGALWHRRWRLFFLATAGLFGADRGETWGVSHYLLRPL